jgi:hypothetical protein
MPTTRVYLNGYLDMPNGACLFAEDISLEVEFEVSRDHHHTGGWCDPRCANVDFDVVEVTADIIGTDIATNREVVLSIDATHPAIRKLVKQKSAEIEDDCLDAAAYEDA